MGTQRMMTMRRQTRMRVTLLPMLTTMANVDGDTVDSGDGFNDLHKDDDNRDDGDGNEGPGGDSGDGDSYRGDPDFLRGSYTYDVSHLGLCTKNPLEWTSLCSS